jgi:hypothetical protein
MDEKDEPKTPSQSGFGKKNLSQKTSMINIMGQATKSLSNHGIERNGGHHHMSMITSTRINEDY